MDETQSPSGGQGADLPFIHSHMAYFLVPLPEPLGLPGGFELLCGAETSADRYRAHEHDAQAPFPPPVHLAASLKFHRVEKPPTGASDGDALFELAQTVLPGFGRGRGDGEPAPEAAGDGPPGATVPRTFVEMAVTFDLDDTDDMGLSDAFDTGLEQVRQVQRAYYLVTRRPLRLATRESMPLGVPCGVRQVWDEDGAALPFQVVASVYLLNMNVGRDTRDAGLGDGHERALQQGLWQTSHGGFVVDYLEFVREADVALEEDGAYRAAVLFTATACEVLLDNLLGHLLWESGSRPEAAAVLFDEHPTITSRVKKLYHPRLGGTWSVDAAGPLHSWFAGVAGLRNRVVHGGYEPTLLEARAAATAAGVLTDHLGDLVSAKVNRYPRTAMALPGDAGVRRRGHWSKRLQRLRDDPTEVDWTSTYARWRTAMQRARQDSPTRQQPTADGGWVVAVLHPGDALQWVVHDRGAGMAAVVRPQDVLGLEPVQQEQLQTRREKAAASTESIWFAGVRATEPAPADWMPEYRLVPMSGVMVDGNDLDPVA